MWPMQVLPLLLLMPSEQSVPILRMRWHVERLAAQFLWAGSAQHQWPERHTEVKCLGVQLIDRQHSLADEVFVVGLVAKVAAIGEVNAPIRCRGTNTVVEPFPDASAQQSVVAPEGIPVFQQATRAVAQYR